ncbi:hypothetical protein HGA89_03130 [bacterium]|nr:hypothetical protein [bacterium]
MIRWPILLPCCLLSAATAAVAGDFPFAARVEILPSVTVHGDESGTGSAFRLTAPQDQCLNVAWRRDAAPGETPLAAVLREEDTAQFRVERPAGEGAWILALTLE